MPHRYKKAHMILFSGYYAAYVCSLIDARDGVLIYDNNIAIACLLGVEQ